jgi:hypothetical protein
VFLRPKERFVRAAKSPFEKGGFRGISMKKPRLVKTKSPYPPIITKSTVFFEHLFMRFSPLFCARILFPSESLLNDFRQRNLSTYAIFIVSVSMSGVDGQGSSNLSHGISASAFAGRIESAPLEIEFWPCSSGRLETLSELPHGAQGGKLKVARRT